MNEHKTTYLALCKFEFLLLIFTFFTFFMQCLSRFQDYDSFAEKISSKCFWIICHIFIWPWQCWGFFPSLFGSSLYVNMPISSFLNACHGDNILSVPENLSYSLLDCLTSLLFCMCICSQIQSFTFIGKGQRSYY